MRSKKLWISLIGAGVLLAVQNCGRARLQNGEDTSSTSALIEPSEGRSLPSTISAASMARFYLYLDTLQSKKVVYFIPRIGGITNLGTRENPMPDFSISTFIADVGIFSGKKLLSMGGSFSSVGDNKGLRQLELEVKKGGFTLRPAPVKNHKTYWVLTSHEIREGKGIEVKCEHKPLDPQSQVTFVECLKKVENEWVPVQGPLLSAATTQAYSSDGNATISFQATAMPSFAESIETALRNGVVWGDRLRAVINWDLEADRLTHKAKISINFNKTYEFFSDFSRFHDGSCTDREISDMWEKVTTCATEKNPDGTPKDCGVSITFYDPLTGEELATPSTEAELVSIAQAVQKKFNDKFFDILFEKDVQTIGIADATGIDRNVRYVYKANREKRTRDIRWQEWVYYNPGKVDLRAQTLFHVSCIRVNEEAGKPVLGSSVAWDLRNPACRDTLGL